MLGDISQTVLGDNKSMTFAFSELWLMTNVGASSIFGVLFSELMTDDRILAYRSQSERTWFSSSTTCRPKQVLHHEHTL